MKKALEDVIAQADPSGKKYFSTWSKAKAVTTK